jgi:hypothetical protein
MHVCCRSGPYCATPTPCCTRCCRCISARSVPCSVGKGTGDDVWFVLKLVKWTKTFLRRGSKYLTSMLSTLGYTGGFGEAIEPSMPSSDFWCDTPAHDDPVCLGLTCVVLSKSETEMSSSHFDEMGAMLDSLIGCYMQTHAILASNASLIYSDPVRCLHEQRSSTPPKSFVRRRSVKVI